MHVLIRQTDRQAGGETDGIFSPLIGGAAGGEPEFDSVAGTSGEFTREERRLSADLQAERSGFGTELGPRGEGSRCGECRTW